jgi:hypothetical protein
MRFKLLKEQQKRADKAKEEVKTKSQLKQIGKTFLKQIKGLRIK